MGKSLTNKLGKKRLQETLRRRREARTVTHLIDHSVPTDLRFQGITFRKNGAGKPSVRVAATPALSPYTIHLNAHLLAQMPAELPVPAPNLLVPERFFLSIADADALNPLDDLSLSPLDVLGQIREEIPLVLEVAGSQARKFAGSKEPMAVAEHPQALRSQFVARPFTPPKPPENFAAYFELPESEEAEQDESDIVSLESMDQSSVRSELAPEPVKPEPVTVREKEPEPTRWQMPAFSFLPHGWHRAIGAFALVAVVFVLPFHAVSMATGLLKTKSGLETASQAALSQLTAGANAILVKDAAAASTSFGKADDAFSQARQSVDDLGAVTSLLLSAVPAAGSTYRTGKTLLDAGQSISSAGERIAQGFLAAQDELNPTPTSRLTLLTTYVSAALPDLVRAEELVAGVDANDVPEEQRETFVTLAAQLPKLVSTVKEFLSFSEMADTVLGGDGTKRYLVVFQNNTEMRATGGFMGSFAELAVKDGVITKMDVPGGGTYDLQGSLKTNLAAPEPLQLLTPRWEFQDANWFPDFPASARQIMDFYEDAGGGSVDGVISVNATYVADLIGMLGPVDMPEYGRTITSDNFLEETQKIVEIEYDREENKPKAFIGDLAPRLLERIMGGGAEDFFAVLDRMDQGLQNRDVQIYFADDALERQVRDLGWGGELKSTDGDYLMLVNTNLGGGKTDAVVREDVDLSVAIDADGGIVNTVTVTRAHTGEADALFSGANNVNYVRLYVPKGAELLSASGFTPPDDALFEIPPEDWKIDDDLLYPMDTLSVHDASATAVYDEGGKTVFGNWVQTKPGAASTFTFTYRLPFTLEAEETDAFTAFAKKTLGMPTTESYSLTVQKQSGVLDRATRVSVHVPETLTTAWSSHDLSGAEFGNARDAFLGALFETAE